MPSNAVVTFTAGSLGPEPCYADEQERFEAYVDALTGQLPGEYSTFVVGATEPDPDDRDKPWLQTEANGDPLRWYSYSTDSGAWVSLHPLAEWAGNTMRIINIGAEADVATLDGGEAGAVTTYGGPMWEVDTTLAARFPLVAGTLPSGTVVASGDTGGAEEVTLTEDEIPAHQHDVPRIDGTGTGPNIEGASAVSQQPRVAASITSDAAGGGEAHNNMPPYYGILLLKKTNRLYYRL